MSLSKSTLGMSNRSRHHVAKKTERTYVTIWMMQHVLSLGTGDRIASLAVDHPPFKHIFHRSDNKSRRRNRRKASRWWKEREDYMEKLQ